MKKRQFLACLMASLMLLPMMACVGRVEKNTEPPATESESKSEETSGVSTDENQTEPETDAPSTETLPTLHNNGKNIGISIFWDPPMATVPPAAQGEPANEPVDFITDEQYDWIAQAGITHIEITNQYSWTQSGAVEKILALAAARNLTVSLHTGTTENFRNMTDAEIAAYLKEYENNPAVNAVYLCDEPANAASWARVYKSILAANPSLTPKVNLLPHFAQLENYVGYVEDFIVAVGRENLKELSYDQYPFPDHSTGIGDFYYNLNLFREIGLKYNVDTAFYIQSIGEGNNFRRTNANEIRFQVSAGLAYGIKNYKYFTWWTTGYCPEEYYAIISPYGEKTDIYDGVKEVNETVAKVGPILANLDAIEVYHTRVSGQGTKKLPSGSFVSQAGRDPFIYSFMEDRVDGRNYLMIVNRSFIDQVTETFTLTGIHTAYNCTDGTYQTLDLSNGGKITHTFKPGEFLLIALGENDKICNRVYDESSTNLAYKKAIAASETNAAGGYYASCVVDGILNSKTSSAKGWQMSATEGWIEVDLGRVTEINRIDLYATGTGYSLGTTFPRNFRITVSVDGENYTAVVSRTDYTDGLTAVPTFPIRAVEARYVRIEITNESGNRAEIAEIRIFNDDGTIPEPDETLYEEKKKQESEGGNVALGKPVTVSSDNNHPEWGQSPQYVNDGDIIKIGWVSKVGLHMKDPTAPEWICIDLQEVIEIDRIVLTPRQDNGTAFPKSYDILISDDGETWTVAKHIDDPDSASASKAIRTITFEPGVKARYVKIYSLEMTLPDSGAGDGYIFILSEFEIYKRVKSE